MSDELSEALTRWTVRLAVACYLGRVLVDVSGPATERRERIARRLWTAGCGLYLLHVAAAFQFYHDWSHAQALRFTAQQTEAVVGLDWGGGLYVNYAFTTVWIADVLAWWRLGPAYPRKLRRVYWAVQGLFAFIVFNATVVFGPAFWKWIAVVVGLALAAAYGLRRNWNAR